MKCSNCGLSLVEGDLICPNCGEAVQYAPQNEEPPVLDIPIEERVPEPLPEELEEDIAEFPVAMPVDTEREDDAPKLVLNTQEQIPQKKSGNKWLIFGICGVTVLALAVLLLSFGPLNGWFLRTFCSPEALFKMVHHDAADSTVSLLYSATEQMSESSDSDIRGAQLHIKPSKLMLDMLALSMNSDSSALSWLSDIVLTGTVNNAGSLSQNTLGLSLGENDIISLEQISDKESGKQWFTLPELSNTALMVDSGEYTGFDTSSGTIDITSVLPEEKLMQEIVDKYLEMCLSAFSYVEKRQETFCVEDIEQQLTVLEARATEEELLRSTVAFLLGVKEDPNIKQILDAMCQQAITQIGEDSITPDYYSQFLSAIDEELEACSAQMATCDPENILTIYTYINNSNKLVGIRFAATDMQENIQMLMLNQGNRVAIQVVMDSVVISGSCSIDTKINGKLTLYVEEEAYLTCSLEDVVLKNNRPVGTFVITPSSFFVKDIAYAMTEDVTSATQAALNSYALELTLSQEDAVSLSVLLNNNNMLTIEASRFDVPEQSISVPQSYVDVLDQAALADWTNGLDIMTVMQNLSDAGVPSELLLVLVGALASPDSV